MARKHNVDEMDLQIDDISFWGEHELNQGGMRIQWSGNIGWGELDIVRRNDKYEVHTEHMDYEDDKEFTKKILQLLLEKLVVIS